MKMTIFIDKDVAFVVCPEEMLKERGKGLVQYLSCFCNKIEYRTEEDIGGVL